MTTLDESVVVYLVSKSNFFISGILVTCSVVAFIGTEHTDVLGYVRVSRSIDMLNLLVLQETHCSSKWPEIDAHAEVPGGGRQMET